MGVSLTSQAVIAALKPLFAVRGVPSFVRSDNGPEFIATEVKTWLQESGTAPYYIDPGCPWQNGFQESFHGKLRDELLDREVFLSVAEAQVHLETHRRWYNEERPHSSLKYQALLVFRQRWQPSQPRTTILRIDQNTHFATSTYNKGHHNGNTSDADLLQTTLPAYDDFLQAHRLTKQSANYGMGDDIAPDTGDTMMSGPTV